MQFETLPLMLVSILQQLDRMQVILLEALHDLGVMLPEAPQVQLETQPALLEMHLMPHEAPPTLPVVAQVRQFETVQVT